VSGRPSILVVRFGALGDVVLATPLLRAIHAAYPAARVTVVTKAAWAPLLTGHPCVAHVEALAPGEFLRVLAARLRATAWDYRLDLHGSLRSRALRQLVGGTWQGWRKPRVRRALRVWAGVRAGRAVPPVAEQYFAAARVLGIGLDAGPPEIHPTPTDEARADELALPSRFVALAPGAAHATKRWPLTHWDQLAAVLAHRGIPTVAVGGPDDPCPAAARMDARGIGLGPTAAVLRRAALAVANDSGLMHLATAVGTSVVALFGPTVPDLGYGPHRSDAVVLARALPCRPCSVYGGAHCPLRHHRCMIDLMPETVAATVEARLG